LYGEPGQIEPLGGVVNLSIALLWLVVGGIAVIAMVGVSVEVILRFREQPRPAPPRRARHSVAERSGAPDSDPLRSATAIWGKPQRKVGR
jgi:hypothetical protein